jgi:hypothetical protein
MRSLLLAVSALALVAGAAHAETQKYMAMMKGASEVPANDTAGTGMAMATLTYTVTYSGLTGSATAAHFHGPAAPGANAPPTVPMTSLASPIKGTATLTDAQVADLQAGKWYFNVHTAAHAPGEIRGQVMMQK